MGKKSRDTIRRMEVESFDGHDDDFDGEFDLDELSRDIYSTDWGGEYETEERFSVRRKIERRADMKKLYSELDEWEEFGRINDW